MPLIKLIYRILHFEAWLDHDESVNKTFYLITLIFASISGLCIHGLFVFFGANIKWKFAYILALLFACVLSYFFITVRLQKEFIKNGFDKYYYNFGRYNTLVKPILFMFLFAVIVVSILLTRHICVDILARSLDRALV